MSPKRQKRQAGLVAVPGTRFLVRLRGSTDGLTSGYQVVPVDLRQASALDKRGVHTFLTRGQAYAVARRLNRRTR